MGYYMSNVGSKFAIKNENKTKALTFLKCLVEHSENLSWIDNYNFR